MRLPLSILLILFFSGSLHAQNKDPELEVRKYLQRKVRIPIALVENSPGAMALIGIDKEKNLKVIQTQWRTHFYNWLWALKTQPAIARKIRQIAD